MKCSTNYYTASCNVRCVQQDSCAAGHYTCDQTTGAKVCNNGFVNPDSNCITKRTDIQLCPESDGNLERYFIKKFKF